MVLTPVLLMVLNANQVLELLPMGSFLTYLSLPLKVAIPEAAVLLLVMILAIIGGLGLGSWIVRIISRTSRRER